MRVLINVVNVKDSLFCDLSFFTSRKEWLSGTGIYVEFLPTNFEVSENLVFGIFSPTQKNILVYRYSASKFFVNLISSGGVVFYIKNKVTGETFFSSSINFNVVFIDVNLLYSYPYLLDLSVSDIRFFCNKLSERCINGTRLILFTSDILQKLCGSNFNFTILDKYFDMIFSIITERGLSVFVTLFDSHMIYTDELLVKLKKYAVDLVEKSQKFKVFWDISCGTPFKYIKSTVDLLISRTYKQHLRLVIPEEYQGKNFTISYLRFIDEEEELENSSVIRQIYRVSDKDILESQMISKVCSLGQGIEYVSSAKELNKVDFSIATKIYNEYKSISDGHQH